MDLLQKPSQASFVWLKVTIQGTLLTWLLWFTTVAATQPKVAALCKSVPHLTHLHSLWGSLRQQRMQLRMHS